MFDALVAAGKAELIDWEVSYKLAWQRGGHRRLAIARAKYRVVRAPTSATDADGPGGGDLSATVVLATAPMPPEAFPRSLAAPSMLAHVIAEKHCRGMPLNRLEDQYSHEGTPIDRGTMSRWLEDAGATVGATVIQASHVEAMRTAFCLSTDATGIAVQPIPPGQQEAAAVPKRALFRADR